MSSAIVAPAPSVVHVTPVQVRRSEPTSPFILSLKKLMDEAEAERLAAKEKAANERAEYEAWVDAMEAEAVACEAAARADEAAEELGRIQRFA